MAVRRADRLLQAQLAPIHAAKVTATSAVAAAEEAAATSVAGVTGGSSQTIAQLESRISALEAEP